MKNYITYYTSLDVLFNSTLDIPGKEIFSDMILLNNKHLSFFDRTGSIQAPLNIRVMDHLKLPLVETTGSFFSICDTRIKTLMEKAETTKKQLVVMYSGGVDSTLIISSLLKNFPASTLKNVIVLLSVESVCENYDLFDKIKRTFTCKPSNNYQEYLGNSKYLFVIGEHADQLFGSKYTPQFIKYNKGNIDSLFDLINLTLLADFFKYLLPNSSEKSINRLVMLLVKLADNAPIAIDTYYKFFWWINFTCKWQSVYIRSVMLNSNIPNIIFENNYTTFYSSIDFQRWSMNNASTLGDPSKTYKHTSKEYIIDVTKDASYWNKGKIGSLSQRWFCSKPHLALDTNNKIVTELDSSYFNYENDFL